MKNECDADPYSPADFDWEEIKMKTTLSSMAPKEMDMKNNSKLLFVVPKLISIVCLLSLPLIGGCQPTVLKWEEEVKLHDGRVIVVKRIQELTESGFPVSKRGFRKYYQFCYAPMHIIWKSKPDYFPETFDIVDGKAYAKVSISGMRCRLHGYPETNALYFRWGGKAWLKIPYEDYPKGLRYNMLNSTQPWGANKEDVHGFVTIADKEKSDAEIYYVMRKFPEITGLNETLDYRNMCEKEKLVNGQTTSTPEVFLPATTSDCQ